MKITNNVFRLSTLVLISLLVIMINALAYHFLTNTRLDLTENKLYTLSKGTKDILANIKEPITIKLYYSKKLALGFPNISSYATYVSELLQQYQRLSHQKISVQIIDPPPFSSQEDEAIAHGLQAVPVNNAGANFYFGLVMANSVDDEQAIPFLQLNQERFLEYDITSLIYQLNHPEKPVVGVISSLPLEGMPYAAMFGQPNGEPWVIWQQMSDFYQLKTLDNTLSKIPDNIDLLMLINPKDVSDTFLYAIDQYLMRGGRVVAFIDTYLEQPQGGAPAAPNDVAQLNRLLNAWGLTVNPQKVLADRKLALPVRVNQYGHQQVVGQPFWLVIPPLNMNQDDMITGPLDDNLLMSTPTVLSTFGEPTTLSITPLMQSSVDSAAIDSDKVAAYMKTPQDLQRNFLPSDRAYLLAARVEGQTQSLFGEKAVNEDAQKDHLSQSQQAAQLLVIADSDLLRDHFWLRSQDYLGQRVVTPISANGNFVLNAIDNLTGSSALMSLRAHGAYSRPFTKVLELQQNAQQQYHAAELALQEKLQLTEQRLQALNDQTQHNNILLLSPAQQQEVESFREEQRRLRQELRDVQHELQKDINQLMQTISWLNIALIPGVIIIAGSIIWARRVKRRK